MTTGLIIAGATSEDSILWAVGAEGRARQSGRVSSFAGVPAVVRNADKVTLILPGMKAASRQMILPIKGDRALSEAAALAFEDILSEPVDRFHFAFSEADEEGQRYVSAVPVAYLEDWLSLLKDAGIEVDAITVDHLALALKDGQGTLLQHGQNAALMLPDGGMTAPGEIVEALIDRMGEELPLMRIMTKGTKPAHKADFLLEDDQAIAAYYMTALEQRRAPNFRRGIFRKKKDWSGALHTWRVAAGLMAACVLVWLGGALAEGIKYQQAASALMDDAVSKFSQAFPNTAIRDLRRQAAQRAGGMGSATAFLPLSAELATVLEEAAGIELTGISFNRDNELIADLQFPDATALERLKSLLDERGVQTREGGNLRREQNGDYSGRLFLGGV